MRIKDITQFLEKIAPPQYQESYDNSGLIVGDASAAVTNILVSLDATEDIIDEAIARDCNFVVAHHPIVFKGLKKITGKNYVERTILKAIKNDIAIFAIHTNLDSVLHSGVNTKICEKLGIKNCRILAPKKQILMKLTCFCPKENTQTVLNALHEAGAGQIGNYKNCSFRTEGIGTFEPNEAAKPHIGSANTYEEIAENRIEVIFPTYLEHKILSAMRRAHPYEEVAYYLHTLENDNQEVGAGMIGELDEPIDAINFLQHIKREMQAGVVRYTPPLSMPIKKVAVCGGSGSFLLHNAIAAGADMFITADFKYHEFFDADKKIVIADIGHYESEQYTTELLVDLLRKKIVEKNVFSTQKSTNPVKYM